MNEQLLERLKTVRNLTEIAVIVINLGREDLLPTILELLLVESQDMVDDCCVAK